MATLEPKSEFVPPAWKAGFIGSVPAEVVGDPAAPGVFDVVLRRRPRVEVVVLDPQGAPVNDASVQWTEDRSGTHSAASIFRSDIESNPKPVSILRVIHTPKVTSEAPPSPDREPSGKAGSGSQAGCREVHR